MNVEPIRELAGQWRAEAALYRRRGREDLAAAAESYADELEASLREWVTEPLTIEEAAEESGYSYSALQHRLTNGSLHNVGETGAPRVRRCDLPRKGRGRSTMRPSEPDLAGEVLSRRIGG